MTAPASFASGLLHFERLIVDFLFVALVKLHRVPFSVERIVFVPLDVSDLEAGRFTRRRQSAVIHAGAGAFVSDTLNVEDAFPRLVIYRNYNLHESLLVW
jgi:hypothetical protein